MSVQTFTGTSATSKRAINGSGDEPAIVVDLTGDIARRRALRLALKEATALGLKLRISGADVVCDGLELLPDRPRTYILKARNCGLLWHYLGGTDLDAPALELSRELGVEPMLVQSRTEARQAIRQLICDIRTHPGHLGLDVETSPHPDLAVRPWARIKTDGGMYAEQPEVKDRAALSPYTANIATLQLYAGGDRCFVFQGDAAQLVLGSHWLRRQHLVAHNAGFETAFLRHRTKDYRAPPTRRTTRQPIECTMQQTNLLTGVAFGSKGLDDAVLEFLGLTVPKDLQLSDWGAAVLSPGQIAYAASDAILAWRLFPMLRHRLRLADRDAAYTLQRDAIPAVADMELRGLLLDREEHRRQCDAWAVELAEARRSYQELTSAPPPTTNTEIQGWLETVLSPDELARWPRTRTAAGLSTRSGHLRRLTYIESCRPVLALLAHMKLLSTFGPKLAEKINPVTGRIHASYHIAGTKAGRFSCNHPNLQQLPSKAAPGFRRCIIAAPGHVLVGGDWNQVEVRAAAWLSNDVALNHLYEVGRDLHSENAARIAGVPLADVTKDMRSRAKAVTFGTLFGQQPPGLVEYAFEAYGVNMSLQEAEAAQEDFFCAYPQLREWMWDNWRACKATQEVRIGVGRMVEAAWELEGRIRFTQACNLPIQGICADAMLRAIRLVYGRLARAGIRGGLVASVHDELMVEVVEADATATREILHQAMLDAFRITFPGAPCTNIVEIGTGHSWAELKD
jgi:DNA polymerase-1